MNDEDLKNFLEFYNSAENDHIRLLDNKITQIFSSNAFNNLSYNKNITSAEDVTKYIDEMHEDKFEIKNYNFSQEEFNFLINIIDEVENIQNQLGYRNKILPYSSLVSSLGIIRIIDKLPLNKKDLNIFEIGPGSGYTGAMLIKKNYNYFSVENTQGFYVWQSLLYKKLSKNFQENALYKKEINIKNKVTHFPWWEFSEFFTKNKIFNSKVDLIICDHTLAEVRRECLRYIAFLSKDLLNINNYAPIFLVRTFGAFINSNYWEILKIFNKAGFINIQFSNFLIFVPNNSHLAKDLGLINFFPKNSIPSS